MSHNNPFAGWGGTTGWRNIERVVKALVDRADEMRLDLVAKLLAVGCRGMRIIRFLVLPDRDNRELVRRRDALQNLETQIALVLAGGIRELPQQAGCRCTRSRRDLDVAHDVDR